MNIQQYASKALVALGAFVISITGVLFAPAISAHAYGAACNNGYVPAGRIQPYGVQDVCAMPPVIDYRGFVNPVSARLDAPPPERFLPEFARFDANLPPCFQYDRRTFDGYCAPAWVPLGY